MLHILNQSVWAKPWLRLMLELACEGIHMPPIIVRNGPKPCLRHGVMPNGKHYLCGGRTYWWPAHHEAEHDGGVYGGAMWATTHHVTLYLPHRGLTAEMVVWIAAHEAHHVMQKAKLPWKVHAFLRDDWETEANRLADARTKRVLKELKQRLGVSQQQMAA